MALALSCNCKIYQKDSFKVTLTTYSLENGWKVSGPLTCICTNAHHCTCSETCFTRVCRCCCVTKDRHLQRPRERDDRGMIDKPSLLLWERTDASEEQQRWALSLLSWLWDNKKQARRNKKCHGFLQTISILMITEGFLLFCVFFEMELVPLLWMVLAVTGSTSPVPDQYSRAVVSSINESFTYVWFAFSWHLIMY